MKRAETLRHFDAAKLLELDLSASVLADVKHRYQQNRLEILDLRNRATREAWVDSARFNEEVRKLERELRHQLGPDDYDVLLYATGKPNRVVLQQVLAGSSAEDAGLEPEDVVVRYGTLEIFHPSDLAEASTRSATSSNIKLGTTRRGSRGIRRVAWAVPAPAPAELSRARACFNTCEISTATETTGRVRPALTGAAAKIWHARTWTALTWVTA